MTPPSPEAMEAACKALGERPHPPGCPENCHLLRVALALDSFAQTAREQEREAIDEALRERIGDDAKANERLSDVRRFIRARGFK